LWLLAFGLSAARGQDWASAMFNHTSHDFGTVARGAKVEHRFVIENIYEEDARLASVRSTCGCTSPVYPTHVFKTWDKIEIVAKLDTRGFIGQKDATLKVVFAQPFPAEVQLHVHAYIRSDVVVQPGVIQFATVAQGSSPPPQKVSVDYAGRSDWRILKIESANPHLQIQAAETYRAAGQVAYELRVTLKDDAPVGYIRDQLVLVTNDTNSRAARVPVPVEGVVAATVAVRPSSLQEVADAGETLSRRLVIEGRAPFRVLAVRCTDERIKFAVPRKAERVHLIPVSFTAGEVPEKVSATIHIETDAAGKTLDIPVQIRVMPHGPVTF
jgi:hypothetical protein